MLHIMTLLLQSVAQNDMIAACQPTNAVPGYQPGGGMLHMHVLQDSQMLLNMRHGRIPVSSTLLPPPLAALFCCSPIALLVLLRAVTKCS